MLEQITIWEEAIKAGVLGLVGQYGGLGVLVGMFLESSIIPIPSEAILVSAGLLGIDPVTVAIYGGIGSTLGSIVGYYIGKIGGRPVIKKVGKYFFITEERLLDAENEVNRHGPIFVLVARLIPLIPFKVFSIASGILRIDIKQFLFYTLIGTFVRAYMLAWLGVAILQYQEKVIIPLVVLGIIAGAYYYFRRKGKRKTKRK